MEATSLTNRMLLFLFPGEEIVVVTSSGPPITRSETIKQLKQDIAEFYDMFKKRYLALRGKHIKELQKLRRLTNGKYGGAVEQ